LKTKRKSAKNIRNINGKRILITGGAGFIGTKLCSVFSENNDIILFDNLRRNSIKYTHLLNRNNVNLVKGNILDYGKLKKIVEDFKPHIIIHLAAIAGIDTVIKDPIKTIETNAIGVFNILKTLENNINNIERFINFSTSEVFGAYAYKADEKHTTNLAPVGEARWTYSASKLIGEHMAKSYHKKYGLKVVNLRPFNIYGPGQIGEGAIHVFVNRAIKGQNLKIHGDGDQIRSWCYISDLIDATLLCLTKKEAIGEVFNIGNPKGTITILNLAEKIIYLADSTSKVVHVPKNYVDVEIRIPSVEKARKLIGFEPKVDLNMGLKKTIEWYRKNIYAR